MKTQLPNRNILTNTWRLLFSKLLSINSVHRFSLMLVAQICFFNEPINAQGSWTAVTNTAPGLNGGVMILLSDGTVMAKSKTGGTDGYGNTWNKLTPDVNGSYVNGTWSTLAPMFNTRLYFSSQVMKDGRVYIAGGEYGTGKTLAETYNPLTNSWTNTPVAGHTFSDANSEILEDGRIVQALVEGTLRSNLIYNPSTNTWANGPSCIGIHNESAWIKLPDNSILFVDRLTTNSERYIPATNTWIADATLPVALYDPFGLETGGAVLLPDGRAFFIGSPGHTAYYTPSGNTSAGTWVAGPDVPLAKGAPDAPIAMMADGKILLSVSPVPTSANHFPSPTTFYTFDYLTNTYTSITAPGGSASLNIPCYTTNFLDLPDGSVLYSRQSSSQYYVFNSTGAPLAAGKPVINTILQNSCTSFTITGNQFNGISQGTSYGDDWQMASNYPIVRLTLGANVYYARTFNWNSTGVQRGNLPDTAQFTIPAGLPPGTYSLVVVANGISSDPVAFSPLPVLSSTLTPPSICSNTAFTYTPASTSVGATYTWMRAAVAGISNGAINTPQNNNPNEVLINTTSNPINVIYAYTIYTSGCSNNQLVTVVVNPSPNVSFTGLASSYNINSQAAVLTGFPPGGIFSGTGISSNTFSPANAGVGGPYTIIYSYTDGNGCSNNSSQQTTVNNNCTPPSTPGTISAAGGNTKVCPGDSKTYSVLSVADATSYTWSPPNGGNISSGQGTRTVTINFTSGYTSTDTLRVTADNLCGSSAERKLTISRNNPSTPSAITGSKFDLCNQSAVPFSISNVAGMLYNWSFSVASGTVVSGQGTNAITADFSPSYSSGILRVSATNTCGTGPIRSATIKATPSTPASISGSSTVCANQQGVPYATSAVSSATNYTWLVPMGSRINDGSVTSSSTTLVTTSTAVTVNFGTSAGNVRVRANNNCGSGSYRSLAVSMPCREADINTTSSIDFLMWPNPASDIMHIDFNSKSNTVFNFLLSDMKGKILNSTNILTESGSSSFVYSIKDLAKGMYVVQIADGNSKFIKRLVIE